MIITEISSCNQMVIIYKLFNTESAGKEIDDPFEFDSI